MTIFLKSGGRVPIPEGYTVKRALQILRDVGHEPTVVVMTDGTEVPAEEYEEAA